MTTVIDPWLTTAEVAEQIRVSVEYVTRQCAGGELQAKKVGHEWRIRQSALEKFMAGDQPTKPLAQVQTARQKRQSA